MCISPRSRGGAVDACLEVRADRPAARPRGMPRQAEAERERRAPAVGGNRHRARAARRRTGARSTRTPATRPLVHERAGGPSTAGSNCAPAASASCSSAQSRSRRSSARPRDAVRIAAFDRRRRRSPVTSMPSTGSPHASIAGRQLQPAQQRERAGIHRVAAQLVARKRARSTMRTRAPARASTVAATEPAGPRRRSGHHQHLVIWSLVIWSLWIN